MTTIGKAKANILLVERDGLQRAFAARILAAEGYRVVETADPYAAFAASEAFDHPLHLLAAEVTAGSDMGGVELSRHLQVMRPGLKVLYLSSVPSEPRLRLELQGALDSFLSKPFTREDLLRKVESLLAQGPKRKMWKRRRIEDWRPAAEAALD